MKFLAFIGVLAILGAIGAGIFFFGGFYNVAAAEPDLGVVKWALVRVRTASIERHATDRPSLQLGDPEVVKAGARAFGALGCVSCHGAPGVKWAKFSEGLHPDPPDLSKVGKDLEPAQIFWAIKNGINMTGMPSFGATGTDDQTIWQVAAFVKKLSSVSADDYKAWTAAP
ncbi:MAG TPA: cytochrome c [Stellaceae bacterium]|nr:cytochrome c [Stellaceae bacterium]